MSFDDGTEFLIQTHSLAEVLAFVAARDEVRRIPASPLPAPPLVSSASVLGPDTEKDTSPPSTAPTLRAEAAILAVEPDPFPPVAA